MKRSQAAAEKARVAAENGKKAEALRGSHRGGAGARSRSSQGRADGSRGRGGRGQSEFSRGPHHANDGLAAKRSGRALGRSGGRGEQEPKRQERSPSPRGYGLKELSAARNNRDGVMRRLLEVGNPSERQVAATSQQSGQEWPLWGGVGSAELQPAASLRGVPTEQPIWDGARGSELQGPAAPRERGAREGGQQWPGWDGARGDDGQVPAVPRRNGEQGHFWDGYRESGQQGVGRPQRDMAAQEAGRHREVQSASGRYGRGARPEGGRNKRWPEGPDDDGLAWLDKLQRKGSQNRR
jgi:hypothetical protein